MKILFYNHTGKVSGAERVVLMILKGLDRERFETALLCPAEGPLQRMASELGIPCHSVPVLQARFTVRPDRLIKYLWSFLFVFLELRRRISALNPDLVHANSIRSGLVATTATLGLSTRVVWHLHDLLPRHPLSFAIRWFAFLFARAPMIAVSQAVADNFAGRLFSLRNRVHVILNGIETGKFQPSQVVRAKTREALDLSEQDFAVGIVGLLTPRKGQLDLIRAFGRVAGQLENATLLIVGSPVFNRDGEYEQILRQTVAKLGLDDRIRFLGERDDVPALMQGFDVLVVNSLVEPFGLVVAEGMASSTPVVAAISGGIPELIQHGHNGLLVPSGDTHTLAEAIIGLAKNPQQRESIGKQGRASAELRFTLPRYLRDLQDFYESQNNLTAGVVQNEEANDLRPSRLLAEQE
jgi:L-malate glycosyltransferase